MLRLNRKLEYGVIALLHLEQRPGRVASVREMAKMCGVPLALLGKIMQSLKNAGIVSVQHGNQGGYQLNRPLEQINLLELTTTLVGPIHVVECLDKDCQCPVQKSCAISEPLAALNKKIIELFQSTSLQNLKRKDFYEASYLHG